MITLLEWLQSFTPAATGIWLFGGGGSLAWVATLLRERRLDRKLSFEDREAKRAGFTAQISQVQGAYAELLTAMGVLRNEYDDYRELCHNETDALRRRVTHLDNLVTGFKRKLVDWQIWINRQGLDVPPELMARVQSAFDARSDE